MPIIKKPDYTIFASEAKNGELSAFPDLLRGWGVTIDQTAGKPPMEWFNTLQKRTDEWLTYLSQRGISEWDNMLDYPKNAVVQSGGKFYVSITENKSKSPDKSQSDWKPMAEALNIKIADATLKNKGIVQLSSATDSTSETMAATPKAVKDAYDLAKSVGVNTLYPVGIVVWFAQNKNPNTLFPGTTWKYIGENRTVRLASADGSDVMTTGGSDSAKLEGGHMPAHAHTFSANTSTFDYGTKGTSGVGDHLHNAWTDTQGDHTHTVPSSPGKGQGASGPDSVQMSAGQMGSSTAGAHAHGVGIGGAGAHSHTVGIGAHSHSVSGTTSVAGSGVAFSVTNSFIKLMGWYRSA